MSSRKDRVMPDATLKQGNRLNELILRESDPHRFIQNLLGNWGAVQKVGRGELSQSAVEAAVAGGVNPYASEKVRPVLSYPRGYRPIATLDQVTAFSAKLGQLDDSQIVRLATSLVEAAADGIYLVPKPSVLAIRLGISDPLGEGYGQLLEQGPLAALSGQRPLRNWREGKMGPDRLRVLASTKAAIEQLEAEQEGDFLVIPAQTGKLYAGYSVRNSRWEIEHAADPAQWALPAYCLAWMLFANPHRLEKNEHLAIDCPGDEHRPSPDAVSGSCLFFCWNGSRLRFVNNGIGYASGDFGSASAFR
ncbi:MAG: hypothetical protein HYW33_00445 [Candidatus Blackburnbacteria bacterium]|nr:hypothetical protein [Candidatus Blackburnbacteria bacterium]